MKYWSGTGKLPSRPRKLHSGKLPFWKILLGKLPPCRSTECSLFYTKITASVTKSSRQDRGPCYLRLLIFSYTYTLPFCWKIKSCCDLCFPQQIKLQTTVQWYIFRDYSSVRIGFSMINKRRTLPIVYIMLLKTC